MRCIEVHRNPQRSTDVHRGVVGSSLPQRGAQGGGTEIHKKPTEILRGAQRYIEIHHGQQRSIEAPRGAQRYIEIHSSQQRSIKAPRGAQRTKGFHRGAQRSIVVHSQ